MRGTFTGNRGRSGIVNAVHTWVFSYRLARCSKSDCQSASVDQMDVIIHAVIADQSAECDV